MLQIQTIIHQLEVGGGFRVLKYGLLTLAIFGLMVAYNFRVFKDMSNPEAMDAAQLARNIAGHKGYHTLFVRPFSIYLLKQAYADVHGPASANDLTDRGQIRGLHPDIANPPVYPLLLAGLMKVCPGMRYENTGDPTLTIGNKHLNPWTRDGRFSIYPPDFWISLFNQVLLLLLTVALFFVARRLFDAGVAWASAGIFLATDLFWRFSISGLSTILLMLVFLALAWTLSLLDQKGREPLANPGHLKLLAAIAGALIGFGCLTRYSFGWLIVPALLFLILFLGRHRVILCLVILASFVVVVGPWVARNWHVSHTPFGTAGYAIYETTAYFPENRLERSLNPDLARVRTQQIWAKFVGNTRQILEEQLPRLGGSWISAFFLIGFFINFKNPTLGRLRYFLLLCLPVLIIAQALGRTHLSDDSPVVTSENLIVLMAPLVVMFGVGFFFILLDQLNLPIKEFRHFVTGAFCLLICLPTFFSLFGPRGSALSYPPYLPPVIQKTAGWMKEDELMMSDIPWAVAWYGRRQCLWLTLNAQKDFFEIYDFQKPIQALYLTPVTMDSRFLSQWVRAGEYSWGSFALESMLKKELPPYFPLKRAPGGFLPEQLFLTDKDRWSSPSVTPAALSQ